MKKFRVCFEAVIFGLLIFIMSITSILSWADYMLKDAVYQIPRGIMSNIKIIAIDDRTLEELGPIGTWSRSVYGQLIEQLNTYNEAKPAVIAFDILFSGNVDEGDVYFAEKAAESGNVVVNFRFVYDEKGEYDENGLLTYPISGMLSPYSELLGATRAGYSNISQDSDSVVRRIKISEDYNGQSYNAFPKEIYEAYCSNTGQASVNVPVDKYGRTLINYSGRPMDYEAISLIDLLNGKIDCRTFKDSIVIVGAYDSEMQDNFNSPNGGDTQMFGVEIHANIVQSFIQGRFAVPGDVYLYAAIWSIVGMLVYLVINRLKPYLAAVVLILAVAAEIETGVILNNNGTSISLIYMPVVLTIAFVYSVAGKYISEQYKRRQVIEAFKKYVAPEVVEEISKSGEFMVNLGGQEKDIAVLFVDIRGFTTMSEALEPTEVVAILNEYLALTTNAIFKNKGTLDKFVGDATMAVFNSPIDLDDYEYRAVKAALDIVKGGTELEEVLMKKYGRTVGFGVGVHCGKAVIGNVGCDFRMDFTAIGDTVNTSARLEANAKKGQVLISDVLYERIKGRVRVTEIGNIPLKGKSDKIVVYQVDGLISDEEKHE